MIQEFQKIKSIKGTLSLSGDKSISHRALLISSLAKGVSEITNLSNSDDVKRTIDCLTSLGIEVEHSDDKVIIFGKGFKGYQKPVDHLYAGNSGTTARLLTGILAVQDFESIMTGDASLSARPMKRLTEPLSLMGGKITSPDGILPLHISAVEQLNSIKYQMNVSSAQVKSAILLAGLHCDNVTTVIESVQTRNHTENLLGLKVVKQDGKIISFASRDFYPEHKEYFIPGDISSAMFFIVLALITKNSELVLKDVLLNPTRIGCINILKAMGANILIEEKGDSNKELYGDLIIKSSELNNIKIEEEIIPFVIDEIPILTIAGIFADGRFVIRGASELRVKESDRIKAICTNMLKLGLEVEEFEDGFAVSGRLKKSSETLESFGDHRIAMAFGILASIQGEWGKVENFECVNISNPNFLQQLHSIIN